MTPSRIFLLEADGSGRLLLEIDPPGYPNGIGLLDDGTLIWSETMTGLLRKLRIDTGDVMAFGRLSGDAPSADGLVVTDDGIVYVATPRAAGLDVFSRAGAHLGLMPVGTMPTNCALEGDSLIVTDAGVLHEDGQPALGGSIWRVPMGHWRA